MPRYDRGMRLDVLAGPAPAAAGDEAALREALYAGGIYLTPPSPASLALADHAEALLGAAFPEVPPRRAHMLLPVPVKILYEYMREVLLITNPDDEVAQRVSAVMRAIEAECDIASYSTHIAKTGRIHVIEINIVVGENFAPQSVPQLDALRARIWDAIGLPLEQAWLGILFTADPRWS